MLLVVWASMHDGIVTKRWGSACVSGTIAHSAVTVAGSAARSTDRKLRCLRDAQLLKRWDHESSIFRRVNGLLLHGQVAEEAFLQLDQPWNRLQALQHVTTAQEALSTGNMDVAQSSMEEALAIAPRDPNVLTAFGSMLADVGNVEKAILTLRQAVRIEPDAGFEKYMCERISWLYVLFIKEGLAPTATCDRCIQVPGSAPRINHGS